MIDIEVDLESDRWHATLNLRYKRKSMVDFTESITGVIRAVPGGSRILLHS